MDITINQFVAKNKAVEIIPLRMTPWIRSQVDLERIVIPVKIITDNNRKAQIILTGCKIFLTQ